MSARTRIAPNRLLRLIGVAAFLLALLAAFGGDAGTALAAPPTPNASASASGNRIFILTSITGNPVNWEVSISTTAPIGTPPSFGSTIPRVAKSSSSNVGFSHSFFSVKPNTTYHYIVKATDTSGKSSYRTGSVKSQHRDIVVDYSKVTMLNDGDGFFRGKGDLTFSFNVNRCWISEWETNRSLSDGDSFNPAGSRYFSRFHQGTLDLAIYALEDDSEAFAGEFCPRPLFANCGGANLPGRGSSDCYDWAQADTTVFVDTAYQHQANSATEKVTFESPAWDGVRFRVEATLSFTYYKG